MPTFYRDLLTASKQAPEFFGPRFVANNEKYIKVEGEIAIANKQLATPGIAADEKKKLKTWLKDAEDYLKGLNTNLLKPLKAYTKNPDNFLNHRKRLQEWSEKQKKEKAAAKTAATPAKESTEETGTAASQTQTQQDGSATASVPVMITAAMRNELQQMGYSEADIDAMKPEAAHKLIQDKKPAPKATSATSANAKPKANATATTPPATKPAATAKKNNSRVIGNVLTGVGALISFGIGWILGRRSS